MAFEQLPEVSAFLLHVNNAEAFQECLTWKELIAHFVGEGGIRRAARDRWSVDQLILDKADEAAEMLRSLSVASIEFEPMIFGGWSTSKEKMINFVCGSMGGRQVIPENDENTWLAFYDGQMLSNVLEKLLTGFSDMIRDGDAETMEDVAACYEGMLKFISQAKNNQWALVSYYTNPP